LLATSDDLKARQAAMFLPNPFQEGFFRIPFIARHPHGMVGLECAPGGGQIEAI
jgi:hypothetical protein